MKIMTANTLRTELASGCAQIVLTDVVAPRVHRANGASAAASPLAAAKWAVLGRVETPLLPEPKTQIQQGDYASKPEFTTKTVDGLRGVPPRGRPV